VSRELGIARFRLARALRAGGREPLRARELCELALATFQQDRDLSAAEVEAPEAWLAAG